MLIIEPSLFSPVAGLQMHHLSGKFSYNLTLTSYLWFDCLALKLSKNCHNEQSTEGPTFFEQMYIYPPDCSCLNGTGFSALSPRTHIKKKKDQKHLCHLWLFGSFTWSWNTVNIFWVGAKAVCISQCQSLWGIIIYIEKESEKGWVHAQTESLSSTTETNTTL